MNIVLATIVIVKKHYHSALKNTVACVGSVYWLNCMHVLALWACDRCGMFRHVARARACVCECTRVLHTLRTHLMHRTSQTAPAETGCG